jgi:hypothetical protein
MLLSEILDEGFRQVWGRSKSGPVRRYRCTSGSKKGRTVAKASTCTSPVHQKASANFKKTRRMRSKTQSVKRSLTTKRPQYKRIMGINKSLKKKHR